MKTTLLILFLTLIIAGCNKNNLELPQPINSTCQVKCSLAPNPGNCKAQIKKYYYDAVEKTCKEFYWGGCGGAVPFNTLQECQSCKCN